MKPPRIHRARLSPREALLFEAGIKLGGLFHQYLGTPVSPKTASGLSRTIEEAVGLQPFVRSVRVRIDPSRGGRLGLGPFRYRYLSAGMLRVRVTLSDGEASVTATLEPREDLLYPLMSVGRVEPAGSRPNPASRSGRRGRRSVRRTGS